MKRILVAFAFLPNIAFAQMVDVQNIQGELKRINKQYVLYECQNGIASKNPQYLDFEYKEWKPPQLPAVLQLDGVKLNKVHRDEIRVKNVSKTFANATCAKVFDPADYYLDLFTGSIEMRGDDLILRRCDGGENKYILRPSPRAKANFVKTLKAKKLNPKNTTTLIAHYVEINGEHGLEVFKIYEIKPNKTCHLSEILE